MSEVAGLSIEIQVETTKANEAIDKLVSRLDKLSGALQGINENKYVTLENHVQDVSDLEASIANFLERATVSPDWDSIGQSISNLLMEVNWTAIFSPVGKQIWQALNAAIDKWKNTFDATSLATAAVSLADVSASLKTVTANKHITEIDKMANKISLVNTALSKNKEVVNILKAIFPKFEKTVDMVKDSFWALRAGIEDGDFLTGAGLAIENVRDHLNKLQKGVIGIIAVFGEFALLKDAFYDITTGSDNLLASLGQIVIGAGGAAAALYVAFGPAGLVAAGITGIVAAFSGVKAAIDESLNTAVVETFAVEGGMAISELIASFEQADAQVATSTEKMIDKINLLSETRDSLNETRENIEYIAQAVENGAYTIDEKIPEIIESFGKLNNETKMAFEESYDLIIYGLLGAFSDTAEALGYDIPNIIKLLKSTKDEVLANMEATEEAFYSAVNAFESGFMTEEEFDELISSFDISYFGIDTTNLDNAAKSLHELQAELDFSSWMTGDTINTDAINDDIQTIIKIYKDAGDAIKEVRERYEDAWKSYISILGENGIDETVISLLVECSQNLVNQFEEDKQAELAENLQSIINIIENALLDKIPEVIENAQAEYDSIGIWGWPAEMFTGGNSDKNVKDALKIYLDALDEIYQTIQSNTDFSKIEIDSFGWALGAADSVIRALSDYMDMSFLVLHEKISENYSKIAQDAIDEYTIIFYSTGDIEMANEVAAQAGINALERAVNGVYEKIGVQNMTGMLDGMSSMESSLYEKAKSIANNVANTVKHGLDINSPSKVMFSLGSFTMQGFKNGMESFYQPILSSVTAFNSELMLAPAPNISSNFDQKYSCTFMPVYESMSTNGSSSYMQDSSETNELLRTVVSELKKGHIITMDGRALGQAIRQEDTKFYKRTGKGMFEH